MMRVSECKRWEGVGREGKRACMHERVRACRLPFYLFLIGNLRFLVLFVEIEPSLADVLE